MNSITKNISIIIPAYNPDMKLVQLIKELLDHGFEDIIVVNDGSSKQSAEVFDSVSSFSHCTILNHPENSGKGKALKTAFSFYVENRNKGLGVVTADADGQHAPEDIKKVAMKLIEKSSNLILGARDFSKENIPARSRFGNVLTKKVTKLTTGLHITDTQTGLRGIPREFARELLSVDGNRYEFEMKMIVACKTFNREITEVDIDTIYLDGNESSHFNPIVDSIKIYFVFFRFLVSSLFSFFVDVALFALFVFIFKMFMPVGFILVATVTARIFSSLFNFALNRNIVFKSVKNVKRTLTRYFTLAVILMSVSAISVQSFYDIIGGNEVLIKIIVDSVLFLLSFFLQRKWVFNEDNQKGQKEVNYG